MELSDDLLGMLRRPRTCYLATSMGDGSPQLTQTGVDTDGQHVLINSVQGFVKVRSIERDPRVAVAISDPDNPRRYFQVRGRVVDVTTDGAADHIEVLAQKYLSSNLQGSRQALPGALGAVVSSAPQRGFPASWISLSSTRRDPLPMWISGELGPRASPELAAPTTHTLSSPHPPTGGGHSPDQRE